MDVSKDKMVKNLYAPWRGDYVTGVAHKKNREKGAHECVFCLQLKEDADEQHFIIKRFKHTYVMLNLYPYAGGHLLILPYEHTTELYDLNPEVQHELMWLVSESTRILKQELDAHGINVGINLGNAAGAGIPSHLHIHAVPRWSNDTNFMPVIGAVKPVSVDLQDVYRRLKTAYSNINQK